MFDGKLQCLRKRVLTTRLSYQADIGGPMRSRTWEAWPQAFLARSLLGWLDVDG